MMKRLTTPLLIILSAILSGLLPACNKMEEHYSSNPNLRLSFSRDTLTFDTVFSTIGSATRQFMIYNRNKEPLNIETILLASGGTTGFRINVDGRKGDSFSNIGIQDNDSLYVFVEVKVDPNGQNQPLLVEDSVVFSVNGIRQSVLLEAYGQDVHLWKEGVTLNGDITLAADRPYLIYDSLVIAPEAHVTIEKGATFYLHDKAHIEVYGSLEANGTQDKPITFRGDRLDNLLDKLPYDRTPGLWRGFTFHPASFHNTLNHTLIRNGQYGIACLTSTPDKPKLTISNSQITNVKGNLLSAVNCQISVHNSELSNACGAVVGLVGGNYDFTHCTIANFMTIAKVDSLEKVCVALANQLSKTEKYPLTVRFNNTIIDGNNREELTRSAMDESETFDYQFTHCLIKSRGGVKADEHFTNCLIQNWGPTYISRGGNDKDYLFDFRFAADTTAGVGLADPAIAAKFPIDRLGVNRLESEKGPSMGAYEYVKRERETETDKK